MKEPLYIFDPADNLLTTTINYIEAPFEETVDEAVSFEFVMPADDIDAVHVIGGNQVAFKDLEGRFRLFVIREPEDEDGEEGPQKRALCLPGMDELNDAYVEDLRPQDKTAAYALDQVLAGTRYQRGNVADLGLQSTSFYFLRVRQTLNGIREVWGGEIVDRVEIDEDVGITGRFIDIVFRRGKEQGKRWEIDKDIKNIRRRILYYPKTALYAKGKSLETDEGGFTRKITFADVEWSVVNGDPIDKPLGQTWIGDPDALSTHGLPVAGGDPLHRMGEFEDNEEEDPLNLLQKTWNALQEAKVPIAEFDMSIMTFEGISGQEHELARLGHTGIAVNRRINPPIVVEARVMRMKYDIGDPSDGEITLGNYLDLFADEKKLDWVVDQVNDKGGVWDQVNDPIQDQDFPDTIPPSPIVIASGLFESILIKWDFKPSSYIAAYEVYGSQVASFAPDSTNLVFKGKTGGFVHTPGTDQQWYYVVRAVNTHGTASAYSPVVSANTAKLDAGNAIEEATIIDALVKNLSADKITFGTLDGLLADIVNLNADNIIAGVIRASIINIVGDSNFYWDGNHLIAIDPNDSNKYVKLNSSGLDILGGLINITREDGHQVILGGKLQHSFEIQPEEPAGISSTITIEGRYWATNSTDYGTCNRYTFEHVGRYLNFQLDQYCEDGRYQCIVQIYDTSTGEILSSNVVKSTEVKTIIATIDLGVPDGSRKSVWVMLRSSSGFSKAYAKKVRAWISG